MGAVFGIIAGYLYWSPKIIGYFYNELYAKIQFFTFLIGVNLTFFPFHMLGAAGLPRRYADYPDNYLFWNQISSIGSFISLFATFFLLYIIYLQFTNKLSTRNILSHSSFLWANSPYFFKSSYFSSNPMSHHLEFILPTPPKFHTYSILPTL